MFRVTSAASILLLLFGLSRKSGLTAAFDERCNRGDEFGRLDMLREE
jgi:hypothetical protein